MPELADMALSDSDLEQVVGGLERAFVAEREVALFSEIGGDAVQPQDRTLA